MRRGLRQYPGCGAARVMFNSWSSGRSSNAGLSSLEELGATQRCRAGASQYAMIAGPIK